MRAWLAWSACLLLATFVMALSVRGQDSTSPAAGATPVKRGGLATAAPSAPEKRTGPDVFRFSPLQREMYAAARRGADWLCRASRPDGHFANGLIPSLKTAVEGEHYLWQAGAALALARTARFTDDERYAAVARQALLTLLLDTVPDVRNAGLRHPLLPSTVLNRLAAAGRLVTAINELPCPGEDLLAQSEQLCAFLRNQQRPDGSLHAEDDERKDLQAYAAEALCGLAASQHKRPAKWKMELLHKACGYYRGCWRTQKDASALPCQTAAYARAYLSSGDRDFADGVFEMADWLCGLQYSALDARHPFWHGGFMVCKDGQALMLEPGIESAGYAEALAHAWCVARQAGDSERQRRYREATESALQLVSALQYNDSNVQHFAEWYRPALVGGFHASHVDGTLRTDDTQRAVRALVGYLIGAAAGKE